MQWEHDRSSTSRQETKVSVDETPKPPPPPPPPRPWPKNKHHPPNKQTTTHTPLPARPCTLTRGWIDIDFIVFGMNVVVQQTTAAGGMKSTDPAGSVTDDGPSFGIKSKGGVDQHVSRGQQGHDARFGRVTAAVVRLPFEPTPPVFGFLFVLGRREHDTVRGTGDVDGGGLSTDDVARFGQIPVRTVGLRQLVERPAVGRAATVHVVHGGLSGVTVGVVTSQSN
jgi:hypothetical protein